LGSFIVAARSDGRGGFRPFGTYGASAAGGKVWIGNQRLTIGKDGRVNIPKAVMDRYGVKGSDGRMRVAITFSSSKGISGWKDLSAMVMTPGASQADALTGDLLTDVDWRLPALTPEDVNDRSWSP